MLALTLLNEDLRFAKSIPYIFMAQQFLERKQLESQISISAQKGKYDASKGFAPISDPFSVFQKIKGTPKYWKQVRFLSIIIVYTSKLFKKIIFTHDDFNS